MNAAAKKWVAALRSGKYKQAKGRLRKGNGYCCLGVAYAVLGQHLSPETSLVMLGASIQKRLGLASNTGRYITFTFNFLITDNDNGKTFAEIADIIESEPKGLFQ